MCAIVRPTARLFISWSDASAKHRWYILSSLAVVRRLNDETLPNGASKNVVADLSASAETKSTEEGGIGQPSPLNSSPALLERGFSLGR